MLYAIRDRNTGFFLVIETWSNHPEDFCNGVGAALHPSKNGTVWVTTDKEHAEKIAHQNAKLKWYECSVENPTNSFNDSEVISLYEVP